MDKVSPYKTFLFFALRKIFSDRIKHHRLIFCINPGRSGSKYLAELLGTAVEVDSYHEPEPKMIGDYLRMVTDHPYGETLSRRSIKKYCDPKQTSWHASKSGLLRNQSHVYQDLF